MKEPAPARRWAGTAAGLTAAVGYTLANIALRAVSRHDAVWISCVKSLPTLLLTAPFAWGALRARPPSRRALGWLLGASLAGHLVGNVAFQWSLGVIGIALSVPVTLGAIIVFGTAMGHWILGEPVTRRTQVAVGLLLAAIAVLSLGAEDALRSVRQATDRSWWLVAAGMSAALASGAAYAGLGAAIRHVVQREISIAGTMFLVAATGTVSLGMASFVRPDWSHIRACSLQDYGVMVLAGLANAAAFLALTAAYKWTRMVYINALNASQAAMAAVAGIVLFREAPTAALWIGLALTVVGLGYLDRSS